ncbi:GGDEF domain-containing protein [Endozoicomonas sp. G2_1]|uniref:putative bifunctional diguanylate cyclase/phosphodiesterase n=1 Tax=Endozoicomonas sp. G2_1 TaxID=2821091 RepID=UPI001AD9822B|nr:GGDEF domain-containing protein [Endozoicomonas sp. G2_1]
MNNIVKPYLFKASLVSVLAVAFGLALSVVVYLSSEKVRENAIDLVDTRIPVLSAIQHLSADLSEHERIVYEYYASQNELTFVAAIKSNKAVIEQQLEKLYQQAIAPAQLAPIKQQLAKLHASVDKFHQLMLVQANNWDQVRAELAQISALRRMTLPYLSELNADNQARVNQGHQATLSQMSNTRNTVVVFGIAIVLLALLIAWYTRQYLITSAFNTRLALFSERNPNAVMSVTAGGKVTYSNPACQQLLERVGLQQQSTTSLLPDNLLSEQTADSLAYDFVMRVEHQIGQVHLLFEVNWLADIQTYDIHILDISEQKQAQDEIKQLAYNHQESKLPNHYKLDIDLDYYVINQISVTLGLINVSNYRAMVTRQGVECSNGVVSQLAAMLVQALPELNLYHIAENQFAVVWQRKAETDEIDSLVERLKLLVEDSIITCNGEFFVELDFGFSFYPQDSASATELFKNAFTASMAAVEQPHNNSVIFDRQLTETIEKQVLLQDKLRSAISANELFLVFQPQLDLSTDKITGIETLVRWRHQGDIVSPAEFIPLAEQTGLIVPIGQWILKQACLFAKHLTVELEYSLAVAVNISPRQFSHPKFVESVEQILSDTGLPPQFLELEITEGVFVDNEEAMLVVLKRLKSLGVQLSIDDFGTGYSSLAYLKQFPVDKLKIDQAFIRSSHENDEDKVLVNTIIALGQNLGLKLIAEGVELIEHVDFLRAAQCDEIQGYWFSRPLEQADLLAFLEKH